MKKLALLQLFTFLSILLMIPGCEVVGGIFKAGVWVGVFLVVMVVAIIIGVLNRRG